MLVLEGEEGKKALSLGSRGNYVNLDLEKRKAAQHTHSSSPAVYWRLVPSKLWLQRKCKGKVKIGHGGRAVQIGMSPI